MNVRRIRVSAGVVAVGMFAWTGNAVAAGAAVFWASDPVAPGQAVMILGDGFGPSPSVEVVRLPDEPAGSPSTKAFSWPGSGQPVKTIQAAGQSLKFVLPENWQPGVFAVRIAGRESSALCRLNRPQVWWTQGDLGTAGSPGGWIRLFGKNLVADHGAASTPPQVCLVSGPRTVVLPVTGDGYAAKVALPPALPPGEYTLHVHSGQGGPSAWSTPQSVGVRPLRPWPQEAFNVRDFGAEGNGVKDDTSAVRSALERAEERGGVVFFPRGRYRLSGGLEIPRHTVLRGANRQTVCLAWTDLSKPPEALVKGTHSFGIEELTLYAQNYRHAIVGDLGSEPQSGNVFLRGVRVRADAYRGHPTPELVDERFRESLRLSTGGGDTVRLGGENVEITDCDLYGSGRSLFLSRVRGGRVADNRLYNGRWGWYCISGSDGLCFEGNVLQGADLMSTGGGLNCLDGSTSSQNVYFARNQFRRIHGWDREAMTSDAGGDAYFGSLQSAHDTALVLAGEPNWRDRDWAGAGVFVLDGKGAGQVRRLVRQQGTTVEIDRPWTVPPDAESKLCITMFQGHYLLLDNEFVDTGAMQFYGTSIECIVAGNRGTRMAGFRALGLWYHGYQPSWFCQFLGNEILEGNYYHWQSATTAKLEISGAHRPPYDGPLNRGAVVRGNHLHNNAQIRIVGTTRDAVVEGNRIEDVDQGIFVSETTQNVLLRDNSFEDVAQPVVDEEAVRKAAEARLKRFLGRREPVAVWTFEGPRDGSILDRSGNGFSARIEGGVTTAAGRGTAQAASFDGTGCLRVEEPAVFNAPDITVALWVRPATVAGRRGLVAKRFGGTVAPLVLTQNGARIGFEAAEEDGHWGFNFASPPVLEADRWTHLAAVVRRGEGIRLFADGKQVAEKKIAAPRAGNNEPLVLGRDAWGGDPPQGNTPGFFVGRIDDVKIWTRPLSAEEIRAEFEGGPGAAGR